MTSLKEYFDKYQRRNYDSDQIINLLHKNCVTSLYAVKGLIFEEWVELFDEYTWIDRFELLKLIKGYFEECRIIDNCTFFKYNQMLNVDDELYRQEKRSRYSSDDHIDIENLLNDHSFDIDLITTLTKKKKEEELENGKNQYLCSNDKFILKLRDKCSIDFINNGKMISVDLMQFPSNGKNGQSSSLYQKWEEFDELRLARHFLSSFDMRMSNVANTKAGRKYYYVCKKKDCRFKAKIEERLGDGVNIHTVVLYYSGRHFGHEVHSTDLQRTFLQWLSTDNKEEFERILQRIGMKEICREKIDENSHNTLFDCCYNNCTCQIRVDGKKDEETDLFYVWKSMNHQHSLIDLSDRLISSDVIELTKKLVHQKETISNIVIELERYLHLPHLSHFHIISLIEPIAESLNLYQDYEIQLNQLKKLCHPVIRHTATNSILSQTSSFTGTISSSMSSMVRPKIISPPRHRSSNVLYQLLHEFPNYEVAKLYATDECHTKLFHVTRHPINGKKCFFQCRHLNCSYRLKLFALENGRFGVAENGEHNHPLTDINMRITEPKVRESIIEWMSSGFGIYAIKKKLMALYDFPELSRTQIRSIIDTYRQYRYKPNEHRDDIVINSIDNRSIASAESKCDNTPDNDVHDMLGLDTDIEEDVLIKNQNLDGEEEEDDDDDDDNQRRENDEEEEEDDDSEDMEMISHQNNVIKKDEVISSTLISSN
ncbi:hypothetical protein SNEBB_008058 [Seison nebaliae]|nr:hypothetical protein SNEBB_008058 [Seison nebaliae]